MSRAIVRFITPAEAAPLRQQILRPTQTLAECIYEHDHLPSSLHFGAFLNDQLIGVGSITVEACPHPAIEDGRRLRGMAVDETFQGEGVGGLLMGCMLLALRDEEFRGVFWCNARTPAVRFYLRHGWETVGDNFETPPIGPHVRMIRRMA